jgi:hypothetical protein
LAAGFLALALLAKEEAVLLPVILAGWIYLLHGDRAGSVSTRLGLWVLLSTVLLGGYFALRSDANALTPGTAPYYYQFVFGPAVLVGNLASYVDRAATLSMLAVTVAVALLRRSRSTPESRIRWRIVGAGVIWLIGGYGITLFLPVRSSLYACFPSVGVCMAAAEICRARWTGATDRGRRRATMAAIVLALAAGPIHLSRTNRWVDLADLSSAVLASLAAETRELPEGADVVLQDDRTRRVNLESAFGSMLDDGYELHTGRRMNLWVEPPLRDAALAGLKPPCDECVDLVLALQPTGSLAVVHSRR